MPVGEVRRNPQTGDTYRLEQVGPDLQWVELGDDAAVAAEQAARLGPVGSFAAGMVDALTFGAAGPSDQLNQAIRQQHPVANTLGQFAPLGAALSMGAARGLAAAASTKISMAGQQAGRRLIRRPSNIFGRATAAGQSARLVEGGMEAVPGLNVPGILQKSINQRRINGFFGAAMGLSDESLAAARLNVDDVTSDILTMFRTGYGELRTGINAGLQGRNAIQATALIEEALSNKMLTPKLVRALARQGKLSADDLLEALADVRAYARAPNVPIQDIRVADDIIERMDDLISETLKAAGKEELLGAHKVLNTRYAIWREVRKGRGVSADGQLNPRTLDGRFTNRFGDNYLSGQTFKDPDANTFMQVIREGAGLDVGLPSSGTAERAALGALVLGTGGALANQ